MATGAWRGCLQQLIVMTTDTVTKYALAQISRVVDRKPLGLITTDGVWESFDKLKS